MISGIPKYIMSIFVSFPSNGIPELFHEHLTHFDSSRPVGLMVPVSDCKNEMSAVA